YTVDIFIPTYGEPLDILQATMSGCNRISYPHKTYILDDSGRPEVKKLAGRMGCNYIAMPNHEGAKAGNINYALKETSGELIVVLDADFIPLPDILEETLGLFNDEKVAVVQGPQTFYNLDSFQHEYSYWHEQKLFYQVIQPGKNNTKSAFWCGSPSVVRRKALESIGGVVEESLTEDIHTTIRLISKGYYALFINKPVAVGIAPATLDDFLGQRFRWAQGTMQILRSRDNPLWAKGFTFPQRISFLASMTTYFDSIQKLIYLAIPVISLTTGLFPIREFGLPFLFKFIPYFALGIIANMVIGRGCYNFWLIELYNILKMFTFIRAMGTLFTGKAQKFKVTNKQAGAAKNNSSIRLMYPQITVLGITIVASIAAILIFIFNPAFLKYSEQELIVLIIWAVFTSILMLLGISRLQKISKRTSYRFNMKKYVYWRSFNTPKQEPDLWQEGFSANFSTTGMGVELCSNGFKIGDSIDIRIPYISSGDPSKENEKSYYISLKGIIMGLYNLKAAEKYKVGVLITGFNSGEDKNLYISMLHQPENLLLGEKPLKRKHLFRRQIAPVPAKAAIDKA
ncbi:MAG: glycosyltransferase, partial [Actinobacteria bacterium]|nr:glycosyltransferase [Actinomycetota bacterium]